MTILLLEMVRRGLVDNNPSNIVQRAEVLITHLCDERITTQRNTWATVRYFMEAT